MKRLTKSNNRKICGVCGGVAEFFGIDATIVRLIAVILIFCGIGTGLIVYLVAAFILPESDSYSNNSENIENLKSANVNEDDISYENIKKANSYSEGRHSDEEFNAFFDEK